MVIVTFEIEGTPEDVVDALSTLLGNDERHHSRPQGSAQPPAAAISNGQDGQRQPASDETTRPVSRRSSQWGLHRQ